jgi:hypothetical protein
VPIAKLENHVISQHKTKILECSSEGMFTVEWSPNTEMNFSHWKLTLVLLNGLMLFPMLFKKDNIYYTWLAASSAIQSDIDILLKGEKGGHYFTGRALGIDNSIDYVARIPEQILTFSNVHAKQCMTKNSQEREREVIKVTFKLAMKEFGAPVNDVLTGTPNAIHVTADKTKSKQYFPKIKS